METSVDKVDVPVDNDDILIFLKEYPVLQKQYLFFNCFVISSDKTMLFYKKAQAYNKNLNDIEIHYTSKLFI